MGVILVFCNSFSLSANCSNRYTSRTTSTHSRRGYARAEHCGGQRNSCACNALRSTRAAHCPTQPSHATPHALSARRPRATICSAGRSSGGRSGPNPNSAVCRLQSACWSTSDVTTPNTFTCAVTSHDSIYSKSSVECSWWYNANTADAAAPTTNPLTTSIYLSLPFRPPYPPRPPQTSISIRYLSNN